MLNAIASLATASAVWQLAVPCTDAQWVDVQRQAAATGWAIADGIISKADFNPLTDAFVVAGVRRIDGVVQTSLRDHSGLGEMIYHCAVLDFHTDDEKGVRTDEQAFVLHEMLYAFLEYVHERNRTYENSLKSQPGHAEMRAWLKG